MSEPKLTETFIVNNVGFTSLEVSTEGGVLRVTQDPGFDSDNGDGCPYRSVYVYSITDDVYGVPPSRRTVPGEGWWGFFPSRQALAELRLPIAPGQYTVRVYGGSLFTPWVPGQEGPFIEWGYTDLGQNPSGVSILNQVVVNVSEAGDVPPPPAGGDRRLELDARLPEIRDNTLAEHAQAKASWTNWAGANRLELDAVIDYLADLANGFTPPPPSLKTHKGRAIIGLLQAGAATIGRLPK